MHILLCSVQYALFIVHFVICVQCSDFRAVCSVQASELCNVQFVVGWGGGVGVGQIRFGTLRELNCFLHDIFWSSMDSSKMRITNNDTDTDTEDKNQLKHDEDQSSLE